MSAYIRLIFRQLSLHKIRTTLTILAVVIATASLVLISTVGELGKEAINQEINSVGLGSLSISARATYKKELNDSILTQVQGLSYVKDATPIFMQYSRTKARSQEQEALIWGITEGSDQLLSLKTLYGQLFSTQMVHSSQKVCLVDQEYAQKVYKRDNIVGKTINVLLNGSWQEYTVLGVVSSGGSITQGILTEYAPCFVYLPYTTMQKQYTNASFSQIMVQLEEGMEAEEAQIQLEDFLNRENEYFQVDNIAEQKQTFDNILNIITAVLSVIAGISSIVSGIGIMTVMVSSVSEQKKEIGIKKSIGAFRHHILFEFILEAFTISCVGSIIGTAFSLSLLYMSCFWLKISLDINWFLIVKCITFSVVGGMLFGIYPAYQASKLKPIDAFRSE